MKWFGALDGHAGRPVHAPLRRRHHLAGSAVDDLPVPQRVVVEIRRQLLGEVSAHDLDPQRVTALGDDAF
jgi:hypothetical protein